MATADGSELRVDVHSIEPIHEADKDSTGLQQMWIWAGANIAPINWDLGALGIVLKLGLWETIAVIVLGNIVGCGIFFFFQAEDGIRDYKVTGVQTCALPI